MFSYKKQNPLQAKNEKAPTNEGLHVRLKPKDTSYKEKIFAN